MAAEALAVGTAASVAGLFLGLGFARGLGALFDAAGMGIPRGAMDLAPRTIVIALSVGIGVTLVAAIIPAVRATRVSPVAAMRDEAPAVRPRHRGAAPHRHGRSSRSPGWRSSLQGLLGGGTATARLGVDGRRHAARLHRRRGERALRRAAAGRARGLAAPAPARDDRRARPRERVAQSRAAPRSRPPR